MSCFRFWDSFLCLIIVFVISNDFLLVVLLNCLWFVFFMIFCDPLAFFLFCDSLMIFLRTFYDLLCFVRSVDDCSMLLFIF